MTHRTSFLDLDHRKSCLDLDHRTSYLDHCLDPHKKIAEMIDKTPVAFVAEEPT